MDLPALLRSHAESTIDDACRAVARSHLPRYEVAGAEVVRDRVRRLHDLTVEAVATRRAADVVEFARELARERYAGGVQLFEVQTAFNALEEALWRRVLTDVGPELQAEALGLVSTVLGLAKDELARTYVSLASRTHAPSLDLKALFDGTEGS